MKSKFILSTLALLGFSSCDTTQETLVMYGTPIVDYRFIGEVTDESGNPIKGIEVKISSGDESTTTDDNGLFEASFEADISGYHLVTLTDVDGAENGGEFATKELIVTDYEEDEDYLLTYDLGRVELETKKDE